VDDRVHNLAGEVFEVLAEFDIPIYANVISRMEFIDLIFRKQVTLGAIQMFNGITPTTARLKDLKEELQAAAGRNAWTKFCALYSGEKLFNEWEILEDDFGLYFVETLEGQTSEIIDQPLNWGDMVKLMGKKGIRGPDAMIVNLFLKSRLSLLMTTDNDLVESLEDDAFSQVSKTILHLC